MKHIYPFVSKSQAYKYNFNAYDYQEIFIITIQTRKETESTNSNISNIYPNIMRKDDDMNNPEPKANQTKHRQAKPKPKLKNS